MNDNSVLFYCATADIAYIHGGQKVNHYTQ